MISTEHLQAEPYIYRTELPYPARKINRIVAYKGLCSNRIGGEMYGTVSPLCFRVGLSDEQFFRVSDEQFFHVSDEHSLI